LKISIITINLNNSVGLVKTISSVLKQSYSDYEYLIIDGASNDGSINVIKDFEDQLTYWISEPDTGIYNALNKGISIAKGEYIQFLNSGDIFFNENILEQIFSKNPENEIIYTDGYNLNLNMKLKKCQILDPLNIIYLIEHGLFHAGTFTKREVFSKIGLFNESNRIISDTEFFVKAFLADVKFQKIDLASVVIDPYGISQNNFALLKEERDKMIIRIFGRDYFELYNDRHSIHDQLIFLKKSQIIKYILNHRGNFYINKLIKLF
jgi:glycosyltransferase involved in cell wall biosynthesis